MKRLRTDATATARRFQSSPAALALPGPPPSCASSSNMDVVLLFPGQGSQKPGMAKDLADRFPQARQVLEVVDRVLGVSLSSLAFAGPEDELTATQNAQP